MKARFITIAFALFAVCTVTKAQSEAGNLIIGYGPLGSISERISMENETYKYHYKSFWNANLGYEKQFTGILSYTEFTYSKGKFDNYELKGSSQWFNPAQTEDITSMSLTQYSGTTINKGKRIQFPLYYGIGTSYLSGGAFHNLTIDGAVKARVKFFITNGIGIYGGVSGRAGWGSKKAHEKGNSSSSEHYNIINTLWAVDAGLVINLK